MPPELFGKLRTLFGGRERVGAKKLVRRDPRYIIHGSLLYRPAGGMDWHRGITENLSTTGVLFRGEAPIPVNTPIELSITPPRGTERKIPEGVFCWGTVVRTTPPNDTEAKPVLAAKIQKYRTKPRFLTDADIPYERMA
jgi:hypothetical protein